MKNQLTLGSLAAVLATTLWCTPAQAQGKLLLREGDVLPGYGTIDSLSEFAMNSNGSWLAFVRLAAPAPPYPGVLIRDGQPIPIASTDLTPIGGDFSNFLDIDAFGNTLWMAGAQSTGDWVMMVNQTELLREGQQFDLDGNGSLETVSVVLAQALAGDGSGDVYATFRAANGGLRYLVHVSRGASGVTEIAPVAASGFVLPTGAQIPISSQVIPEKSHHLASNAQGELFFAVEDQGLYRYHPSTGMVSTVVEHGAPGPFVGTTWEIYSQTGMSTSSTGIPVFPAALSGPGEPKDILAQGQQILLSEADTFKGVTEGVSTQIIFSRPIRVSASGAVLWSGGASGPVDDYLLLNHQVIVKPGSTKVDGVTIELLGSIADYAIDSTGTKVLVKGRTEGLRDALIEIDTNGFLVNLPGCTPKLATLEFPAGTPKFGGLFPVNLKQPQVPNAVGVVLVSTKGYGGPCGLFLPGLGELLVDIYSSPFLIYPTWNIFYPNGGTALLGAEPNFALQDVEFYAQGLFYSPLDPVEPVRFSNGLRFSLAF